MSILVVGMGETTRPGSSGDGDGHATRPYKMVHGRGEGVVMRAIQLPSEMAAQVVEALVADVPPDHLLAGGSAELDATSLKEGQRQAALPGEV
jgi:hypothetical protein